MTRRGALLLAAALSIGEAHALERDGAPACPAGFTAWSVDVAAEPDARWTGRVFRISDGEVVMTEVGLELRSAGLRAEELRWFDAPDLLLADDVAYREWWLTGDEAGTVCRRLVDGLGALGAHARTRCFTLNEGERVTLRRSAAVGSVLGGGTIALGANMEPPEAGECVAVESAESLQELGEEPEVPDGFMPGLADVLDDVGRSRGLETRGFAAVPRLRTALAKLRSVAGDALPGELPAPFLVEAAVAPADYAEALLLERLADEPVAAVFLLGDLAGPRSARALTALLADTEPVDPAGPAGTVTSLALRALVRADPEVARRSAVAALGNAGTRRAALGVFALTDAGVDSSLRDLDANDPDALRRAARRLLDEIASTDADETMRRGAERAIRLVE